MSLYQKYSITKENAVAVLEAIEYNLHVRTRQISRQSGISQLSVDRILHAHKMHPYHLYLYQNFMDPTFKI